MQVADQAGLPGAAVPDDTRLLVALSARLDLDHGTATVDGRSHALDRLAIELLYHGERGLSLEEIAIRHGRLPADVRGRALALQDAGLVRLAAVGAGTARLHAAQRSGIRHVDPADALIGRAWHAAVDAHPDRCALVLADGEDLTYGECDALMTRTADLFHALGLRRGDRIAIWSGPHLQSWLAFWTALRLGIVVIPLDPTLPAEAVNRVLPRFDVRVLLADGERLSHPGLVVREAPRVVEMDPASDEQPTGDHGLFSDLLRRAPAVAQADPDLHEDDPALLVLTSGTTADSKAVCQSQGAIFRSARDVAAILETADDVRVMTTNGLSGFRIGYLAPALVGRAQVLAPGPAPGHVARAHDVAARLGVTMMISDPAFVRQSLDMKRSGRLARAPALRVITAGGATMPPSVRRAVVEELEVRLGIVYGLTEACGLGAIQFDHDGVGEFENSVGRLAGMVAQLCGADGNLVPDGQHGRLWILTDRPMSGYVTPHGLDVSTMPGGWIDTGDIAWRNSRGDIVVAGRAGRVVSLATGQLISPALVEDLLAAAAGVSGAVILPCTDSRGAMYLQAYVEAMPGTADTRALANRLRMLVRERLGEAFVPHGLKVVAALPRTASGKVRRTDLERLLPAGLRPAGPVA